MNAATLSTPFARTAVIALHYQNDVIDPRGKVRVGFDTDQPGRAAVLDAAGALLAGARAHGLPIVHVRIAFREDYADLPRNAPVFVRTAELGALRDGSWGAQFYPALEPDPARTLDHVVHHQCTSGFIGTPLERLLAAHDVRHLIVAGVATHSTVEMTARHAADLGYRVTVAADACACADRRQHDASLESMRLIAAISSVAELFGPASKTEGA
ncbi:isochorismatase [Burkholderia cepacia JBK9]|uniref:cysteine hydrolase family protein n=1 Tax=Burkholderia arboris TaxID=488730 RepID=UPI000740C005|nr:cysteine hydrolase [Burkholderia arboris]ALX16892.1 isochorismatase [Burkholderia cepacia JBK9]MCA8489224.1 cysteine hydrolase [Burkholderia arboris]